MSDYLTMDAVTELRDAARDAGLANAAARQLLMAYVNRTYVSTLPDLPSPGMQVQSDLNRMNATERLVDGSVPLEVWLRTAVGLTEEAGPRAVFQHALDTVGRAAAGEPDAGVDAAAPELKEQVIFRDDMVPFRFLRGGADAGAAIARVKVAPHEGGAPTTGNPHVGTAWLVTGTLVMTNHHVVNARRGGVPPAADVDLRAQAAGATLRFDYDDDDGSEAGDEVPCTELVAWDAGLDYALLRVDGAGARRPLPVLQAPLRVRPGDHVAVNVIQHPGGEAKRVALRNNLVVDATDRDLRYFTDTRQGSSGSPVLTDDWVVAALHRAAARVDGVSYQGKQTAVVNVGTQLAAILTDLEERWPGAVAEVRTAQRPGGPGGPATP